MHGVSYEVCTYIQTRSLVCLGDVAARKLRNLRRATTETLQGVQGAGPVSMARGQPLLDFVVFTQFVQSLQSHHDGLKRC